MHATSKTIDKEGIELGEAGCDDEEKPFISKDVLSSQTEEGDGESEAWLGFDRNAFLAVCFYWITSLSLVFLNKSIMKGDVTHVDAPLFMSWTQFFVTVLCCIVLGEVGKHCEAFSRFPPFEYDIQIAWKVLPLTGVFLGMIIFNNLCLKYVQVSFYQVARSLTVLFNLLFSYCVFKTKTNNAALLCCVGICIGYGLGCDGEIEFSVAGALFGGLSSAFVALYSIYVKKVSPHVDDSSEKLIIYNNVNACIVLLPIVLVLKGERTVLIEHAWAFKTPELWAFIVVGGIFGFLINFASFIQIKFTSPLSHNVSGTAKAAAQTLIAIALLGNRVNLQGVTGIAMVLGFSFVYARVK